MFSAIKSLFGGEKVIDAAVKGVDALWFTDEEKAEIHKSFLKAYEPFKIAQRILATIFCVPYALGWIAIFIASFWVDEPATVFKFQLEMLSGDIAKAVWLIVGFYFMGGVLNTKK